MKPTILIAIVAALIALAPAAGGAQTVREELDAAIKDYLATHPDEVGEIVKGYMVRHPEALAEIFAEVLKHRPPKANTAANSAPGSGAKAPPDRSAAIAGNAAALFSSPHQVTLGNPHGDVTLVEFFDYSCGFCKRALPDMLTLIKDDPNLKIVLKELPILGPGSVEAARIAVAVRMQDPEGQKYLAFHQQLLGAAGPASKDKALAAARDQGLDMARLETGCRQRRSRGDARRRRQACRRRGYQWHAGLCRRRQRGARRGRDSRAQDPHRGGARPRRQLSVSCRPDRLFR